MKLYDVFLKLVCHGRNIGKVRVEVVAESAFGAALAAERRIDRQYGQDVYGHIEAVRLAQASKALQVA